MKTDDSFIRKVMKKTGETIYLHSLFHPGDRVLVGLSGGKDSLSLVDLLVAWNKRSPVKIELAAAYIDIDGLGHKIDLTVLKSFCALLQVPFYHRTTTVDLGRNDKKDKCFLCSWYRRKALFNLAQQLECTKLALGHHLDDIVTTLLMNMCHKGIFATMPVKMPLFKGALTIVRPLGLLEEKDIQRYSELRRLVVQSQECPYGKKQSRAGIRRFIEGLTEVDPHAKINLFHSMSKIRSDYLS